MRKLKVKRIINRICSKVLRNALPEKLFCYQTEFIHTHYLSRISLSSCKFKAVSEL